MNDQPQQTVIIPSRPMRATSIKGLTPTLPERGKIKIGIKGAMKKTSQGNEFQPPLKLDHFIVTTMERGEDNNLLRDDAIHASLGDDKPTEIPVRLLYDDPELNFVSRYAAYKGRTLWCSGDGERAIRIGPNNQFQEISCPCYLSDPAYEPKRGDLPRCKMNGSLSVIIDGASGLGGVWKFRTTSYNSINSILSCMMFLRRITGGILANIPLKLKVQPKQAVKPTDGSPVQIYFVTLEYDGDMRSLQQTAHQIALDRATTRVSIAEIETEARRLLALAAPANAPLPGDDAEEVVAEWYPEQYDEEDEGRPTRRQFRQDAANGADETEVGTDSGAGQGKVDPETQDVNQRSGADEADTVIRYVVSLIDGDMSPPQLAEGACAFLMDDMKLRAQRQELPGLAAAWQDNQTFIKALEEDDHRSLVSTLQEHYKSLEKEIADKLTKAKPPVQAVSPEDRARQGQTIPKVAGPQAVQPVQMNTQQEGSLGNPGTPPMPAEVQQQQAAAASTNTGTASAEVSLKVEEIRFGAGRGINWPKQTQAVLERINTLTAEELMPFRQLNERLLSNMNLAWKEGAAAVAKAIAARSAYLQAGE